MSQTLSKALQNMMNNRSKRKFDAKSHALAYFEAKKNKKRLPTFQGRQDNKNPEYNKLTIEQWEKKYLI